MSAAALADPASHIDLPGGTLRVETACANWPLETLCDFAARANARRGFLVVSKLLGRHLPARPSRMRAAARALADRIPGDLPGPLLVMGLAETAICLGQTLHEELHRSGRDDALFLHSTRQRIDAPLLAGFEEPHSHASTHLIYRPAFSLSAVRTLVLVDDEASTGTTFVNLANALAPSLPRLVRIETVVLTDWSNEDYRRLMPCRSHATSLLSGRLSWQADAAAPGENGDARAGTLGCGGSAAFGRTGLDRPIALPDGLPADFPPRSRLRIVGTGEFTYLPFLLAEWLEQAGHDVVVQATTRSPARLGGAIASALRFSDNDGSGAPNFLYNLDTDDGRLTLICHETPDVDPDLVAALGARTIRFRS